MKRYLALVLFILAIVVLLYVFNATDRQNTVQTFDLADYQEVLSAHPSDLIVEEIRNQKHAEEAATVIFIDVLGIDTTNYDSYWVEYDPNNNVWHVAAFVTNPANSVVTFGGCPEVLIRSNGEVLAVWHSK